MRKLVLLALGVLLFSTGAAGVSAEVSVDPDDVLWLGEDFEITATCTPIDDHSFTVYIDNITHDGKEAHGNPGSQVEFQKDGNNYVLDGEDFVSFLEDRYGYSTGEYTFFTKCDAGDDGHDTVKHSIVVEALSTTVESDLDGEYFAGSQKNISLSLYKEGEGSPENIGADADPRPAFSIYLNGEEHDVSTYYDHSDREWVLRTDLPGEAGSYDLELVASHAGATATDTRTIEVQDTLQFAVTADETQVNPGSTVRLTTEVIYRGDRLALEDGDIEVAFGGDTINDRVSIEESSRDGSTFTVDLPERISGAYDLIVVLDRPDTPDAEETIRIDHPVPVTGVFLDADDDPISYEMLFDRGGETVESISGNGEYTTALTPGEYNVTMIFDGAELWFQETVVDDWNDIVRFRGYEDTDVPGLVVAGLYAYRTGLDYDAIELALDYSSRDVDNPDDVVVYHCDAWNMDRADCFGTWSQVSATFDDVDNTAYVTGSSSGEGAYAIGERERLSVRHSSGDVDSAYTPDQELAFSGLVRDGDDNRVENATVSMDVAGADISDTVRTGADGTFAFSFQVPGEAGTYTVELAAEGDIYRDSTSSFTFDVERPASIDIVAPQNVNTRANTTQNTSFYIENTGYTAVDLEPLTENIPFFADIKLDTDGLSTGENREGRLILDLPPNNETDTHTAELGFAFNDQEESVTFGITVEAMEQMDEPEENDSAATVGMLTRSIPSLSSVSGMADRISVSSVVPDTDSWFRNAVLGIILFQVGIVVVVVARGRMSGGMRTERDEVLRTVSDIKNEVGQQRQVPDTPVASAAARWRNDEVERDHVLRAMSHIKQQIGVDR